LSALYARAPTGKNSGARDALSLQLRKAEFFGGAWIFQPWFFDFRRYSTLDIYSNDNAFVVKQSDLPKWMHDPSERTTFERYLTFIGDGTPHATTRQLSRHDMVMEAKAGGEFGIRSCLAELRGIERVRAFSVRGDHC
jgi:hypothetical protein